VPLKVLNNMIWDAPAASNNHHQDDITCFVADPELSLHFPLLKGGG